MNKTQATDEKKQAKEQGKTQDSQILALSLVPRYQSTPLKVIPPYWYECWTVNDWMLPFCVAIQPADDHQTQMKSNWRQAIDYLFTNWYNTPWSSIPVTVLLTLHKMLVFNTRRQTDDLVVKPGEWRQEVTMLWFEPLETLFKDPKILSNYWKTSDLKRWMGIQLRLNQFRKAHPDCKRPFESMCLQSDLSDKEWTTLRKIAFVPPQPQDLPQLLVAFWSEMQRLLDKQPVDVLGLVRFVHQQLTALHPFARSGNGRVARIWCGFLLARHGYLPIPFSPRKLYQAAVVLGDVRPIQLQDFFAHQLRLVHSTLVDVSDHKTLVDYMSLVKTLDAGLEDVVRSQLVLDSKSPSAPSVTAAVSESNLAVPTPVPAPRPGSGAATEKTPTKQTENDSRVSAPPNASNVGSAASVSIGLKTNNKTSHIRFISSVACLSQKTT